MDELKTLEMSTTALVTSGIAGVFVLVFFRLVHRALEFLPRLQAQKDLYRILAMAEALVWVGFGYWTLNRTFVDPFFGTVASTAFLIVLGMLVSWYAGRDWIAGVVLRIQDVYASDQFIELDQTRGRVKHLGFLSIEIEQEDGDRVKIPYSKIGGEIHRIHHPDVLSNYYRFQVTVPRDTSAADATSALRASILNTPWASPNKPLRINLLESDGDNFTLEAVFYTTRQSIAQHIEDAVRREFSTTG